MAWSFILHLHSVTYTGASNLSFRRVGHHEALDDGAVDDMKRSFPRLLWVCAETKGQTNRFSGGGGNPPKPKFRDLAVLWFDDFHASLGTRNVFDRFLAVPRERLISWEEFFRSGAGFGSVGLLHVGDERVPSSFHETDARACLFVELRERAV
ncbi:uncharacterized protein K489DRAFT_375710 [Dissoconium aciculare CBS 342.82]|uniref:Uncharacterized protein n=1 Tax=Dissoconium aciculare CBS 342.82 TaxID=1314786 RepID=A0A6J3MI72_9PEZI|nr:uncharacterized protein K489DRAFT_375710 [Dissoconium aciculare CBS 342.82]KAF1827598.1 hypothetical protein K489DRAFT_375710 [Dissoconium aciculare CBS 342.82]